jgi:hypothetical protein
MLQCKVKAEIEILHEAEAVGLSDIGSPIGLPLVRYLAKHINARLQSGETLVI